MFVYLLDHTINMFLYLLNLLYGLYYKLYNIYYCRYSDNRFNCNIKLPIENKYDNNEIKILSYNIDGLFIHYNYDNYKKISNFIRDKLVHDEVNIICLQEVWDIHILDLIKNNLKDFNLYYASPPVDMKFIVGEHSGLLIISKFPIVYTNFNLLKNSKLTCFMTNKGLFHVKIKVGGDQIINIVNTHLQNSTVFYCFNYKNIANNQLFDILNYCEYNNLTDVVIVGDLNLNTRLIDKVLNNNQYVTVPYNEKTNPIITCPSSEEQLDYFLFYKQTNEYKFFNVFKTDYSDHYPIIINI